MKAFLFFPFRVIGWLLRGIFYPWYIALFLRLPWWVLGALAILSTSIAVKDLGHVLTERVTLDAALAAPPPDTVPLTQFDPARHATELGEIQIDGYHLRRLKPQKFEDVGPAGAYLPVMTGQFNQVGAVLVFLNLEGNRVAEWLDANGQGDWAQAQINGMIADTEHRDLIVSELRRDGFEVANDVPVIQPFYKGREAGLVRALGTSLVVVVGFGILAAIFGIIAIVKFLRWMRRYRDPSALVRRPVPPKTPPPLPVSGPPALPITQPLTPPLPKIPRAAPIDQMRVPPASVIATAAPKPNAPRASFRPRTAKQIVEEVFGPNYGRTPPKK